MQVQYMKQVTSPPNVAGQPGQVRELDARYVMRLLLSGHVVTGDDMTLKAENLRSIAVAKIAAEEKAKGDAEAVVAKTRAVEEVNKEIAITVEGDSDVDNEETSSGQAGSET